VNIIAAGKNKKLKTGIKKWETAESQWRPEAVSHVYLKKEKRSPASAFKNPIRETASAVSHRDLVLQRFAF